LPIYEQLGEKRQLIAAHITLGKVHSIKKDYGPARHAYEQARAINKSLYDQGVEGQILESLASLNEQEGESPDSLTIYNSIFKLFQIDITGMFRMTSRARYFKEGVDSSRPNWRWIMCFLEWLKANTSCKAVAKRVSFS